MPVISADSHTALSGSACPIKIGVEYYLENDVKKAEYMQRKLNTLTVRAINLRTSENRPPCKVTFEKKMRE